MAWQFSARNHARREAREQQTLRAIALSFFALAGYVAASAVWELLGGGKSDTSTIGLTWLRRAWS